MFAEMDHREHETKRIENRISNASIGACARAVVWCEACRAVDEGAIVEDASRGIVIEC